MANKKIPVTLKSSGQAKKAAVKKPQQRGQRKQGRDKGQEKFPVVGIGASAGGLDAFRQVLKRVPPESGMAFILIQHLDPNHPSMMVDLLSQHTRLPIQEAREGSKVQPNRVYMIPP